MANLKGHTAVVSGGLGDIGRATVRALARCGANVGVSDVAEPAKAEALLKELRAAGVKARYDRVNVADAAAVQSWIEAVEKELGPADVIVVNAGVVSRKPFAELTPQDWRRDLSINLDGAFHLAHAAATRLLELRKPGRIVLLGSWAGHTPQTHIPAYCVSKAGLRMLCRCLALWLAEEDILVNEVAPGYVDAGLSAQIFADNPELRSHSIAHTPVKRLITTDQVAREIVHLCDFDNQHATGSTLLIDGGLSLLSGPNQRRE